MVAVKTLNIVKQYLKDITSKGLTISHAFIYGSQARGTATDESDIDLLIVSPLFDDEINKYLGILWEGPIRCKYRIEPYPVGEQRFLTDESSPIIAVVKEEGYEVET